VESCSSSPVSPSSASEAQHFEQDRLRESEALFRHLAENAPVLVWVTDATGAATFHSRSWSDFAGRSFESALGLGWLDTVHPDDRERVHEVFLAANRHREPYRVEYRMRRADGVYRWMISSGAPRFGEDGSYLGYVGSVLDIDDKRQAEMRQQVLIAELQHRTRNLLALVRSIAAKTRRGCSSLDQFEERFNARLAALSRVQSLLSRGEGTSVTLAELVEAELSAHGAKADGSRVVVRGPRIGLSSKAVQVLALALHELATNATKYGALAQEQACIEVTWELSGELSGADGQRVVTLRWVEAGVALPQQAPDKRGFGRQLLEQALPYDLGAATRFGFAPDGVHCEIRLPLDEGNPAPI
jgi:PAS domain S-box-containing protein